MTKRIPKSGIDAAFDIEVFLSENEDAVYVMLTGFEEDGDAEKYAEWLTDTLPLLLFESERVQ